MPRTREELEEAAARAERLLDELDPRVLLDSATRVDDLREVGVALTEVAAAERHLFEAVKAARANHRSWGEIASVLGISKQGARDRFIGADTPAPNERTRTSLRLPPEDLVIVVPGVAVVEATAAEQDTRGARARSRSTTATGPGGTMATGPGAGFGEGGSKPSRTVAQGRGTGSKGRRGSRKGTTTSVAESTEGRPNNN